MIRELGAKDIQRCTIYTSIYKDLLDSTYLGVFPLVLSVIVLFIHQVVISPIVQMLVELILLGLRDRREFYRLFYWKIV